MIDDRMPWEISDKTFLERHPEIDPNNPRFKNIKPITQAELEALRAKALV
ncbi:MAG: hypothetical protein LBT80_09700 [Lactobacillaceae bacterium]|nr:hypothetical protein [Lactobacillaceae bacterium]